MAVQVWGPPDDGVIENDARMCTDPDDGHAVIYHAKPAWLEPGPGWSCASCSFTTAPEGTLQ